MKCIDKKSFEHCTKLTKLEIPINRNQIICGNKIFLKKEQLEQYIYLPNSIKIINNKEVENTRIVIPTFITSITSESFHCCERLKEIVIKEELKEIDKNAFSECLNLKTLIIPSNETRIIRNNKIYISEEINEESIVLPKSVINIFENEDDRIEHEKILSLFN